MDDPDAIPSRMRKAKWMWRSISGDKPAVEDGSIVSDLADTIRGAVREGKEPKSPGVAPDGGEE